MALIFRDATWGTWADNPATMIARDGIGSLDLGFAEPKLNGITMIQNKRLGGGLPPINFPSPTVTVISLPFDPKGYEAQVKAPSTDISWHITIPPDPNSEGVWVSDITSTSDQVSRIIECLTGRTMRHPSEWIWRIVVHPLPSAPEFMAHVRFHEKQHVQDHTWLAEQIIGPWDNWLSIADKKKLRFRNANKFQIVSSVSIPGNYATGVERIARYWQEAIKESGDLYHSTAAGGPPQIKILKTAGTPRINSGNMQLHLSIEPRCLLKVSPMGAHRKFGLKKLTNTNPISGNEPKLSQGPLVTAPRIIKDLNVHAATYAQVIYVP